MEADRALPPPRRLARITQLVLEVGHRALLQLQLGPEDDYEDHEARQADENSPQRLVLLLQLFTGSSKSRKLVL